MKVVTTVAVVAALVVALTREAFVVSSVTEAGTGVTLWPIVSAAVAVLSTLRVALAGEATGVGPSTSPRTACL